MQKAGSSAEGHMKAYILPIAGLPKKLMKVNLPFFTVDRTGSSTVTRWNTLWGVVISRRGRFPEGLLATRVSRARLMSASVVKGASILKSYDNRPLAEGTVDCFFPKY